MNFLKKYFKGDPSIWAIIVGLSVFSLLAVYSATGTLAYRYTGGNTAFYILRHSGFLVVGLTLAFFLHMFPYRYYARMSQWLLVVIIPLLVFTLLYGVVENDAARRISIFGFTFQTSDLAKMALIMYLAQRLAARQGEILDFRKTLLPMFIVIGIVCVLILPANFSTAGMLFMVCVMLLFVGRVSFRQLSGLCAVTIVAGVVLVGSLYGLQKAGVNNVVTQRSETWINRVDRFFGESAEGENPDENFQPMQAKIAVGTGGFFGKGPGNSVQRNFLPHPYSDFIFAIIIEEWGVLGGMIVLFLYLNLLYRAILIVRKCDKTFPAFLVTGLSLSVVFQALVNMVVAVGLTPVTGQPLPLISMGGTSILFTGAAFGIILSVSRELRRQEELQACKTAGKTVKTEEEQEPAPAEEPVPQPA
ncbi:MAG: FtsW/RodA/SpoVE family cell cycle protein [Bacteroidales bacterium]|jgi:cell division protein FtsW|nr:FtsW/RodA/SpoVE family cell cycle protein [Bacteroidales bacterium]